MDFPYPEGVEAFVQQACDHHLNSNLHHPESHQDVNQMSVLDIVEMVADWTAMSQEYNQGSCLPYVKKNIHKWGFSSRKQQEIFATIATLDKCLEKNPSLTS